MGEPANPPDPDPNLPEGVAATLQRLGVHDLRETIIYAQERLQIRTEPPEPPQDLPEEVVSTVRQLGPHDLQGTIEYARELLGFHHEPTRQIEPAAGEEIVELTEHPGYVEVVKRQPCGADCDECPHGPYVYHVRLERHTDGRETFHWDFIGRRISDDA